MKQLLHTRDELRSEHVNTQAPNDTFKCIAKPNDSDSETLEITRAASALSRQQSSC